MSTYGHQSSADNHAQESWQDTAEHFFSRPVRITDGSGGVIGLNRPGFRINPTAIANVDRETAYRLYDEEIAQAYKTTVRADANQPSNQVRQDALRETATIDDLYAAYDRDLESAWKKAT